MGNVVNIKEANTEYTKKCAKWIIETLNTMINVEKDIIDEMEDTLEGYKHLNEMARAEDFKADSIDAIYKTLTAVNDIAQTMAKYDWIIKSSIDNKEVTDND